MNLVDKAVAEYAASIPEDRPAASEQVGGDHYIKQKLQPFEACFQRNGFKGVQASVHVKVDKYLTRDKGDQRENLCKAKHCLEVLIEFYDRSYDNV